MDILKRKEGKAFQGGSFFYPRVFEYAIANFLNTVFGVEDAQGMGGSDTAPVNWQTHDHLPVFSCSFQRVSGYPVNKYFFFPITDRHLCQLRFAYMGAEADVQEATHALARQIIDSVQLELSPSSQEQLVRVKSDIGELSLTEEFAPLKWPITVEEIEQIPPPAPML